MTFSPFKSFRAAERAAKRQWKIVKGRERKRNLDARDSGLQVLKIVFEEETMGKVDRHIPIVLRQEIKADLSGLQKQRSECISQFIEETMGESLRQTLGYLVDNRASEEEKIETILQIIKWAQDELTIMRSGNGR